MLAEPAACVVLRLKVTPLALLAFLALLEPWRLLLGLAGAPPQWAISSISSLSSKLIEVFELIKLVEIIKIIELIEFA